MKEEFEKLAASGKILPGDVETLVQMATEGFCMHKSWGFGRIKTVDVVLGKMAVDFNSRPGHSIDLAFAPKILTPISKEHIEARKATDMTGLKQMAALQHHEVIKVIIDSYGIYATNDKVQEALVPEVIDKDDYKKWWETARREMKKDGHFKLPTKKTEAIEYQSQEIPLQERLLQDFSKAKGLKARVVVTAEISKNAGDLDDAAAMAEGTLGKLNEEITSHAKTQAPLALEAVMARNDLAKALGAEVGEDAPTEATVWETNPAVKDVVTAVPAARQRRVLDSFQAHNEEWATSLLVMANQVPARLVGECANLLAAHDQAGVFKEELEHLINHHAAAAELLLWLAKERPEAYTDLLTTDAFGAMLSAIERETSDEKRACKLRDYILADTRLIETLTESADLEVVQDITRAIQISNCFEGMDKRSVLGKIVKARPEIQEFITGSEKEKPEKKAEGEGTLMVSWASLERRAAELEDLKQKRIPANSKEIEIAREYGDLRENHEFKAAKEQQKVLTALQAEWERDLDRARGMNYSEADISIANVGTRVTVTNLGSGVREEFALLGAWDGDPDNNLISYLAPMGQAILGRAAGEEVEFELGGESRRLRVEGIAPYTAEQAPA